MTAVHSRYRRRPACPAALKARQVTQLTLEGAWEAREAGRLARGCQSCGSGHLTSKQAGSALPTCCSRAVTRVPAAAATVPDGAWLLAPPTALLVPPPALRCTRRTASSALAAGTLHATRRQRRDMRSTAPLRPAAGREALPLLSLLLAATARNSSRTCGSSPGLPLRQERHYTRQQIVEVQRACPCFLHAAIAAPDEQVAAGR